MTRQTNKVLRVDERAASEPGALARAESATDVETSLVVAEEPAVEPSSSTSGQKKRIDEPLPPKRKPRPHSKLQEKSSLSPRTKTATNETDERKKRKAAKTSTKDREAKVAAREREE
ncbi:hypothetical protein C8J56DRAFT_1030648 [Mycena floridula]|nr:hypothetical protein C8J56DRAFT_1030648 [Mycena floridula]